MAPRNFDDDRDRTVPPEEDYYGKAPIDLNFNSRENGRFNEGGINPTEEYDRYYRETNQNQSNYSQYPERSSYSDQGKSPADKYSRDDLRYSPPPPHNKREVSEKKNNRENNKSKGKNGSKKKQAPKIITGIIAFVLVIAIAATAMVTSVLGKINYDEKEDNQYVSSGELVSSSKVTNILLLGVDARPDDEDESSRADSMMLISFDREHGCIKMTSFLRDSWVYIPVADKKQRLNAACTYGGYSGVVDTIEYNFGVNIDGYVVADFEMFKIMVDSIGGVEVEVTEKEANEVTNHPGRYGDVTLEAGTHTLTGEQALAYCRIRKIDTDWKRTERQRTVIQQIIKGVVSSGPVGAYKAASNVAPYIQTDLTKNEIRGLIFDALMCVGGGFDQNSCPFDGTWEYATHGGASVIDLDVDANKDKLIDYIYNSDKPDKSETETEE